MEKENIIYGDLTYKIIGSAMEVHRELGAGFLEKVYENALIIALEEKGLSVEHQKQLSVKYHVVVVGDYYADIIVENKVLIELKATKAIAEEHKAQIINYLTATDVKVGLILNFATKSLEYERFVK